MILNPSPFRTSDAICPLCGEPTKHPLINNRCNRCAGDPNDQHCYLPLPDEIYRVGRMLQQAAYERVRDRKPELDDGLTPELRALFVRPGASEG